MSIQMLSMLLEKWIKLVEVDFHAKKTVYKIVWLISQSADVPDVNIILRLNHNLSKLPFYFEEKNAKVIKIAVYPVEQLFFKRLSDLNLT